MNPKSRHLRFYKADVFTDQIFCGNPLAVISEADDLTDREFQQIAREMNLSETVFVVSPTDPSAMVKLRIFTPTQEIPFAGHPVLGTFYVLGLLRRFPLVEPVTRATFETNIGVFGVELYVRDGRIESVIMTQPQLQFLGTVDDVQDLYDVSKALGVAKSVITDTKLALEVVSTGLPVLIVPIRSLTAVRSINPESDAVKNICARLGANGIMAFSLMTVEQESTVHTRMFASPIGLLEDSATGSASGALGGYLVKHGVVDVGPTTEIVAEQGYEIDRPSRIIIQVLSDDDIIQEVKVGGQVVMVAEGNLVLE